MKCAALILMNGLSNVVSGNLFVRLPRILSFSSCIGPEKQSNIASMTVREGYRARCKTGYTPWEIGQPGFNLVEVETQNDLPLTKDWMFNDSKV